MVTKAAPPPSKSRALQPWEADMAAKAKKQSAVEKPMGLFKSVAINAGHLYIDDEPVKGDKMQVVVLAATHENQYYDQAYDPNRKSVPVCFAFGDQTLDDPEAEMAPKLSDCLDPQGGGEPDDDQNGKPGVKCADCWANVMGSADVGKGKACKNIRRFILTTPDALESPEALKNAEARMFKIPVMSVNNWINHMHSIDKDYQRPCYGVISEIEVVPDKKSQWRVEWSFVELVNFDGPMYDVMKKRVAAAERDILSPYPKLEDEPAPPPKKAAGKGSPPPVKQAAKAKSKF